MTWTPNLLAVRGAYIFEAGQNQEEYLLIANFVFDFVGTGDEYPEGALKETAFEVAKSNSFKGLLTQEGALGPYVEKCEYWAKQSA